MQSQLQLEKTAEDLVKGTKYEKKLESCLHKNPDLVSFTSDESSLTRMNQ